VARDAGNWKTELFGHLETLPNGLGEKLDSRKDGT
jgi:hypothetical protein